MHPCHQEDGGPIEEGIARMLELLGKLFRTALFIAMAGLIGWYDFGVAGYMGVATNLFFAAIGGLLVHTWLSPIKKESVVHSVETCSSEPVTDANVAADLGGTAKVETITSDSTPESPESSNSTTG